MERQQKIDIITNFIVQSTIGEYDETRESVENWPDECIENEIYYLLDNDNI